MVDLRITGSGGADYDLDVSSLAHGIQHTTTLGGQPGKLSFSLLKDPSGTLKVSLGDAVEFRHNGFNVFKGNIFTIGGNGRDWEVTAYDKTRYLKNHDSLAVKDKTMADLFRLVCERTGFPQGEFKVRGRAATDGHRLAPQVFMDRTGFDILEHGMKECMRVGWKGGAKAASRGEYTIKAGDTLSEIAMAHGTTVEALCALNNISDPDRIRAGDTIFTAEEAGGSDDIPAHYFVRDNFGVLELTDIRSNSRAKKPALIGARLGEVGAFAGGYVDTGADEGDFSPVVIGRESLMTAYSYEADIDKGAYNEVLLVTNEKGGMREVHAVQDEATVPKWGRLRKIVNVNGGLSKERYEEYAEMKLKVGSRPARTLRIDAIGYDNLAAGDTVRLALPGIGEEMNVYVVAASHDYNGGAHTMTLEVSDGEGLREAFG